MDHEKVDQETSQDESKRKFLKTAGKFAVYTPPALLIMSKANATKSHMYKSVKPDGKKRYCGHDRRRGHDDHDGRRGGRKRGDKRVKRKGAKKAEPRNGRKAKRKVAKKADRKGKRSERNGSRKLDDILRGFGRGRRNSA